jgi:hypothetical protein
MRKFRASRLKQLIFPQELTIDQYHAMTRKRRFPAFWVVKEESIPLSKLASIQIERGMFFSKLIIENSGGLDPITIGGLWNRSAKEARDLLEMIEREQFRGDISALVGDDDSARPRPPQSPSGPSNSGGGGGGSGSNTKPSDSFTINRASLPPAMVRPRMEPAPVRVKAASTHVPPVARTPQLDYRRQSDAIQAACDMKTRQFGELPSDDWTPPAPWAPRLEQNEDRDYVPAFDECDDYATECEPLADEPATALATIEPEKDNPIEKLTEWWDNAKSTFAVPDLSAKAKKRRKLN